MMKTVYQLQFFYSGWISRTSSDHMLLNLWVQLPELFYPHDLLCKANTVTKASITRTLCESHALKA